MSIIVIFHHEDNRRNCEFEDSITIKEMIKRYFSKYGLNEGNKTIEYHDKDGSVKKKETKSDYMFVCNGRILDKKSHTTLKNFFKNKKHVQIQVRDSSEMIGGNNSIIDHKRKI